MTETEIFRAHYQKLKATRPPMISSGFWFLFVFFLARAFFFICLLGLIGTLIWSLQIFPDDKMSLTEKLIYHSNKLQLIVACFFTFGMLSSGFAARMSRRIVVRNGYILALEGLVEEAMAPKEKAQ